MKLDELTVLDYVINQIRSATKCDKIVIATTNFPDDDKIVNHFANCDIDFFRGESENVLDRYYNCAKKFEIENIVRITSDCPLIDPEIVDQVISKYKSANYDYFTNTLIRTYPIGTDVEIFSFETLEKTWYNATLPSEREHVTPFIRNKKMHFRVANLENKKKLGHLRWTLDRQEDLDLIKEIIAKINKNPILMDDILNLFSTEPELIKINENISPDEGIIKSLKKDEEFSKLKTE